MHVLLVKTSSMGDVLHTLPAVTDAMKAIPDLHIDWVIEEQFSQIPSWHPIVDQVIPVAIRRWRKNWFARHIRQERYAFINRIQQRQYDLIIDAQGLLKSAALVTRFAKGIKHGADYKSARESLASWFYHCRHAIDNQQHAVERTRQLFAKSFNYERPHSKGDYGIAQHFLYRSEATTAPYLVFLHATTRSNKYWPEAHWIQLIQWVQATGLKIKLPWGNEHEHQRAIRLAGDFPHVEVLPKLPLQQIAEILFNATAVVSVDTGLSHLTAALDRPNITLFGPTDPALIGGYGKNQIALTSKHKKMHTLTASIIITELEKIIS
ncbi:lipopolysaccharide heptosyltransferase I(EC:2.4.-) [Candidatus Regiella insecticola 5.15]|uniref:Lipopolysaccharide heptosyltransferase 1 n=1 Tax=Candidatus Regiella insecticola 5.15 TaxID=1005043 RepID=G2GYK8_9ENTR|nr:lipopolysaccharide heptosyltransferase RfaC [Candidatus Regiella insecticola]EGY29171.1 lipopolysaccharide heptosyltransferase I(EC:2.4.-) [Candidatus Regiella insecticola 5.15]